MEKKSYLIKQVNITYRIAALFFLILSGNLFAKVSSDHCSNCHTIHNSQNGQPVAYRINTAFSGFEADTTPNDLLLVSDCVGCHTSTGNSTIVDNAPIVFNTGTFNNPLAGGNFYYVKSDDFKGHNVAGIAAQDVALGLTPPGGVAMTTQLSCAGEFGCHGNRSSGNNNYSGMKYAHHTDDSGGITGASVGLSYRFLNGVLGKEDPDWEQDSTNTSHNEYKGSTGSSTDTISYLCAECHGKFHTWTGGAFEVGTASPWFRHPTDIALKSTGEYAAYATYNMVTPVARPETFHVTSTAQVTPGTDIIMCQSCHRAHASPYFKLMRWDYKSTTLSTAISGCGVCHTGRN